MTLTLITGGTGKTGRRVAQRLADVRIAARSTGFDWNDRATWDAALDGVGAVYLSYFPDLAIPGAGETVAAFAERARHARIVLLSGRGEPESQAAEEAVRAVAPQTTVVRCAWFAQNFSEAFLADAVAAGEVALPVDGVREPFVDCEDIADVAAAALTDDRHAGALYELTGPRALTFAEAVEEIARAARRRITFTSVPLDEFAGDPLIAYLFGEVLDGRNAHLADGVQRALGRTPRDFRDYTQRTFA